MGDASEQPGTTTRLGSYEILRALARGGMAELFLARAHGPEGFEKLVVLKKILPDFAASPKFVRLFLDEAKLAATFDHPSIAHVYDMGMVDGNYFFTMEFVHGQDVRNVLRRTERMHKKWPIEHAVQVARNVAAALHYAHERRRPDGSLLDVVHRDVSPSNIVISYDGAVKLLDFGVAKAATSSVKTRTGTLKGKIGYMSPEQAKGAAIDRRCDIFSLGIVLWEMVATRRLFKSGNDLATLQQIINSDPPSLLEVRPETPAELARIAARALAREPADRYATAEEMQLDLEELAREQRLGQSPVALSKHMHGLFGAEIEAWRTAQAQGLTLTEHVVGGSAVDMTTPASNSGTGSISEISQFDEIEEDDEDGPERTERTASMRPSTSSPIGQVIPRGDQTPMPALAQPQPQPPMPMPIATPPPMPGMGREPLMTPSSISAVGSSPGSSPGREPTASGFPLAPREWLQPADPPPDPQEHAQLSPKFMRRVALWVGGVAGALVLLGVIFSGGGGGGPGANAGSGNGSGNATLTAPVTAPVTAPFIPDAPADAAVAASAVDAAAPADANDAPVSVDAAAAPVKAPPISPHVTPPVHPVPAKVDHPKGNAPTTGPKRYDPNSALPPP